MAVNVLGIPAQIALLGLNVTEAVNEAFTLITIGEDVAGLLVAHGVTLDVSTQVTWSALLSVPAFV